MEPQSSPLALPVPCHWSKKAPGIILHCRTPSIIQRKYQCYITEENDNLWRTFPCIVICETSLLRCRVTLV